MSIKYLNAAFKADVSPSARKFVLVAMCDYCDESGLAYPSIETICRKTNQDRKTVRKHIRGLIKQGIFQDTGRKVGKTKSITVHQIQLSEIPKMAKVSSTKKGTA